VDVGELTDELFVPESRRDFVLLDLAPGEGLRVVDGLGLYGLDLLLEDEIEERVLENHLRADVDPRGLVIIPVSLESRPDLCVSHLYLSLINNNI